MGGSVLDIHQWSQMITIFGIQNMRLIWSRSFRQFADRPDVGAKREPRNRGLFKPNPRSKHARRPLLAFSLLFVFSTRVPAQQTASQAVKAALAAHGYGWTSGQIIDWVSEGTLTVC